MIIVRYLVKETLKTQLSILAVLFLIFFCQKLIRILSFTVDGQIPANIILTLLGLGVPEMAQLMLPLSLFLAILMTFGRLHSESEIPVMYACGMPKSGLFRAVIWLTLFTAIVAAINVIWVSPWSARYQDQVAQQAKENLNAASVLVGRFQQSQDGNHVLFIEKINEGRFERIFLAQLRPIQQARPSVVVAESGYMDLRPDGAQAVVLSKGTRYEGTAMLRDFRITDFDHYQAIIDHKPINFETHTTQQLPLMSLFGNPSPEFIADRNWRLTLIFSVIIMAFLVVPLSAVDPRQGRLLSMLPAMLLYLIFFLAQSLIKSNGESGQLDSTLWMWTVNFFYLLLALMLNLSDSALIKRFLARISRRST